MLPFYPRIAIDDGGIYMKLKDKVAIVTGGANGIGLETCRLFAREGAKLMIADIVIEEANKVATELKSQGCELITMKVNVSNLEEINELIEVTLRQFGHIDILANIAGGSAGPVIKTKHGLFANSTRERWEEMINLNLYGTLNCTRAAINHMIGRGTGRIVNFASTAGMIGMQKGVEYSAAKGGIIGFTKALAKEVAPYGINVNCISPGVVGSPRIRGMDPKMIEGYLTGIFLHRLAEPQELATVVLFLASEDSSYITGQNIVVDGGLSLGPPVY